MKRNIQIGPTVYRISRLDWFEFVAGKCTDTGRIAVQAKHATMPPDETLFHEMFHACEKELIKRGDLKADSPEHYVEGMAYMLYHALIRAGWLQMDVGWDQLEFDGMAEQETT